MSKKKPLGIVVYKGPSLIDNKPVIAIATGFKRVRNSKIGKMIQIWILRQEIPPILAARVGEDYSICGDCKHRHFGSCYVNLLHGPNDIYRAFHNDKYVNFELFMLKYFEGKSLRIGAYGDPAAIPFSFWSKFCKVTKNFTGYTHQWKKCDKDLSLFLMASVESDKERDKAQAMGWRTFRIRLSENDPVGVNEFICPASHEGGKKTTCGVCGACSGLIKGSLDHNPCIIVHGGSAQNYKVTRFIKGMKKVKNKEKYRKDFSNVFENMKL